MFLDLSKALKVEGAVQQVDMTGNLEDIDFNGDTLKFSTPIKAEGKVTNNGDILNLTANISGNIVVQCYRCLKETTNPFSFVMKEILSDQQCEEDEIIYFQGDGIDLTNWVVQQVLLQVPMKYLCDEQCKGLCAQCGVDLNKNTCKCIKETIDPRMEVLKSLFKE